MLLIILLLSSIRIFFACSAAPSTFPLPRLNIRKVIDDEFIHGAGGELLRLVLVIILGQAEDVALLQLLTVVVVVGENIYFVQLHGEKVFELFVVLPRVQEELVKLVSVKALVHVEDGEHLELV